MTLKFSIVPLCAAALLSLSLVAAADPPATPTAATPPAVSEDGISIYFNPGGGAEQAIVDHINAATRTIDVGCFHFTAVPLAKALIAAKARGVVIRMVIDGNAAAEPKCLAEDLAKTGIPVLVDTTYHTAHNKVMIFDNATVLTGSYNYTPQSAEENAENALFITGKPAIAAAYEADFMKHLAHSAPLGKQPLTTKQKKAAAD